MYITPMPARCLECRHEWTQETIQNVNLDVMIAFLHSIRCPKCRSDWNRLVFTCETGKHSDREM